MQYQITIQEAIFTLSNLNKQIDTFNRRLYTNFFGPIRVDGVKIGQATKAEANAADLMAYQNLVTDASTLRQAIAQVNQENTIDDLTVTYQLEWLRHSRKLLANLEQLLNQQETRVENGVGVVEYGAYNEPLVQETVAQLSKQANALSSKIDLFNAQTTLTVDLIQDL
ncbi:hypothetical protein [Fundicoccus culcitae]|uniref:Uncharacterized protein n=1 Tax=Fundicoccus culcitae TaxID=2969821 RepID=A0ABY5P4T5_9LACT|nr:hypothetical protein [Fundicoccus culcitae]UUX33586.1 hypothetical protein NRE15_11865 [Fundicoccus culcitae]